MGEMEGQKFNYHAHEVKYMLRKFEKYKGSRLIENHASVHNSVNVC